MILEQTLDVYYRTAKEEEGFDGPLPFKIREIKKSLLEYRRKSHEKREKRRKEIRRSRQLFYDSVDEDVDKLGPYDRLPSWPEERIGGLKEEDFEGVKDLVERHKESTDAAEVKMLEDQIVDAMIKKWTLRDKEEKNKEPTLDDDIEENEEIWEGEEGSDEEWEDEDDDDSDDDDEDDLFEYVGIWEKAEDENDELYEDAECTL
jgi:hypothetical protein